MAASEALTPAQSAALFDILTHRESYDEIEDFKEPGAIHQYGPPFQDEVTKSKAPILQTLLSKFILKLPGLREVPPTFWKTQIADLIDELSQAQLSESYDKGILGIRKTFATAISALIEYPTRASLGGFPKTDFDASRKYDTSNPEDVLQAWQDCLQALVYGDLIDKLFAKAAETDDLKQHDTLVQGMHEFVLVNLASFMHYTLVLSPEGPSILRMIDGVHRMIPYTVMRQTLKIGNVASMISAMVRVILAKVSMASVTNWIGLSSGADEGMNLLQQIISQVLGWDKSQLKKRAEKIEKEKDGPPKAVREELRKWINSPRAEQDACRQQSQQQEMSIVTTILAFSPTSVELSEAQHDKAQDYLTLNLAIRDRDEIIRVLCKRNPDHLSQAIRTGVDAYTPMIRLVHQSVNLADTLWDLERFITDMLKMSKPTGQKGQEKPPSVEDYVDLLHRHMGSTHKFLHQVAKNGKEVTKWWQDYVHMAASHFRVGEKPPNTDSVVPEKIATEGVQPELEATFKNLSDADKQAVSVELDAYRKYIDDLHSASAARIGEVIKRTHTSPYGPGAYLARWQHLLDTTKVTPAKPRGPVRYGNSKSVKEAGRKDVDGQEAGFVTEEQAEKLVDEQTPNAPSTEATLRLFGKSFKEILGGTV